MVGFRDQDRGRDPTKPLQVGPKERLTEVEGAKSHQKQDHL